MVKANSLEKGLQDGWTRATFVLRKDYLSKLKAVSYWDRKKMKEVIDEALGTYLKGKKIKPIRNEKRLDEMKKIVILIIMLIGLVVCNSEAGNYTDQGKSEKEVIECQRKGLDKLIGKTFVAYPSETWVMFHPKIGYREKNFGVMAPEKFTVLSVHVDYGNFFVKVKFDSGRIAYFTTSPGLFFSALIYKEVVPELRKALTTIKDSCE